TMLSPRQHALLYRSRRAAAVALAVADNFAAASELEPLREKNARAALAGEEAALFKQLLAASAYVAAFTFASYLVQTLDQESEPVNDTDEPDFPVGTPRDVLKSMIAGLAVALDGAADDMAAIARARAFARVAIEGLLRRRDRFMGLGRFENIHLRLDADDFTLD